MRSTNTAAPLPHHVAALDNIKAGIEAEKRAEIPTKLDILDQGKFHTTAGKYVKHLAATVAEMRKFSNKAIASVTLAPGADEMIASCLTASALRAMCDVTPDAPLAGCRKDLVQAIRSGRLSLYCGDVALVRRVEAAA